MIIYEVAFCVLFGYIILDSKISFIPFPRHQPYPICIKEQTFTRKLLSYTVVTTWLLLTYIM